MKRSAAISVVAALAVIGAGAAYYLSGGETPSGETGLAGRVARWFSRGSPEAAPGGAPGRSGGFGGGGGRGPRLPMTVEVARVSRADMAERLLVVGNLVGAATVEAGPQMAGRLEAVHVRLGDPVTKGQRLAKIEDRELIEQLRQAEASQQVAAAAIRQREADLRLAQTNLDRSKNLFERQLIPKQTFDDTDARQQAAAAQLDLARAQYAQNEARIEELKINLANTVITSPVSGFVGRRTLDPGAWITPSTPFLSVVDIGIVRLVANIVERDLRKVQTGMRADVVVDAFPNEKFVGRIAHLAPVLDPATRTAEIEVEIDNPKFRLKPGMYARVEFVVERRDNALVVPTSAVVDMAGARGVFQRTEEKTARFHPASFGLMDQTRAEVVSGLAEGEEVVTTGAAALREGDRVLLQGEAIGPGDFPGRGGRGRGGRGGPGGGGPPPAGPAGQMPPAGREQTRPALEGQAPPGGAEPAVPGREGPGRGVVRPPPERRPLPPPEGSHPAEGGEGGAIPGNGRPPSP
jgi:RND family efflux transporter MFP subunit